MASTIIGWLALIGLVAIGIYCFGDYFYRRRK